MPGNKEARRRGPTRPRWRLAPVGAGPYRCQRGINVKSAVESFCALVYEEAFTARGDVAEARSSKGETNPEPWEGAAPVPLLPE